MVAEDFVSFETAKLLKEKGFDELCRAWYGGTGDIHENGEIMSNSDCALSSVMCPTLQMAMKWLREVHKLCVSVCPCVEGYYWEEKWNSYGGNLEERYPYGWFIGTFNSYEQACEEAIKYCLKNLI